MHASLFAQSELVAHPRVAPASASSGPVAVAQAASASDVAQTRMPRTRGPYGIPLSDSQRKSGHEIGESLYIVVGEYASSLFSSVANNRSARRALLWKTPTPRSRRIRPPLSRSSSAAITSSSPYAP